MRKVAAFSGVVVLHDGTEVQVHINADGVQRWGASKDAIAATVDVTDKLSEILNEDEGED